ncbi:MAG: hypothetical protein GWN99_00155 [Gemmatimonadetes bacterium]|uniref:Uncharacterized protein n=1 Tax=Candidatus Kutchimonas denitrificans TaxID=3056748 RepID=A0AAE4Z554_9BACT|nr:hypothetical protein [Gemmatimonadota bacterium]NIR73519.1 hypothetical protein [Candidatus Kutchimonas denitrificans]NIR99478.1 hypothetical protein [Gemmatimonadota bacterium]NIT65098.1 hypothetical protein [Gemmatimonadota bacterium]NIV23631.1 hypothetical protein [Gemmatimonadota bacterium]
MKRPALALAWLGTVGAVVLSVGFTLGGRYDPVLAILTLTVIAVIWYTYFTYRAVRLPEQLEERRRRDRASRVARTLMAEVERLRDELGTREEVLGAMAKVPTVHPWVERHIADAAEVDADVVRYFLKLDDHLYNLSTHRRELAEARARAQQLEDDLEDDRRALATAVSRSEGEPGPEIVKPELDRAKRHAQHVERSVAGLHSSVHAELDAIEELLRDSL